MILDPKTSRKIFELARDQQDELEEVEDDDEEEAQENAKFTLPRTQKAEDEDDDDLEEYGDEEYEEVEEIVRPPVTIRVLLDRDPSPAGSGRRRPQDIRCAAPRKCGRTTDISRHHLRKNRQCRSRKDNRHPKDPPRSVTMSYHCHSSLTRIFLNRP